LSLGRVEISAQPNAEEAALRTVDLRRALRRLPTDQLAAILLHFYLDLPLDTVATALGISTTGVKSRINRGLKRLRYAMQSQEATI
jgi:RNA polymerase sigma-70 factor (ECF subfamily)